MRKASWKTVIVEFAAALGVFLLPLAFVIVLYYWR